MSRPKPLVSVYITNHNYGQYIETAIQSVLNQTFRNYELLIIDDGSTDNSHSVIEKYENLPFVQTVFQKNKGLTVSNNIALRLARGKYIIRLDADDYLDEHALEILAGALEREPEVGLVFPDYYTVDRHGNIQETIRRLNFEQVTLMDQPAHGACTMIRKDFLETIGGYDESLSCQDGFDLWLRFIRKYRVKNINLPLFYYRKHGSSLTDNEEKILNTRAYILDKRVNNNGRIERVLAVIPARGPALEPGSVALKMLGDATVLDWTIKPALAAEKVTAVAVTTPDPEIVEYVNTHYAEQVTIIERPRELARLNIPIEDTILHAVEQYKKKSGFCPDAVVVLYLETPFRTFRDINSLINVMEVFDTDCVISAVQDDGIFYRHNGAGLEPLNKDRKLRLEREQLFREAGQMYAVRYSFFAKERRLVGGKVGHWIVSSRNGLRLRREIDWELAKCLLKKV